MQSDQQPTDAALWAAAYHEAGHAVVGHGFGERVTLVCVWRGRDFFRGKYFSRPTWCLFCAVVRQERSALTKAVAVNLAGGIAQYLATRDPDALARDCESDRAWAHRLRPPKMGRDEFRSILKAAVGDAERILRSNWPAVSAVAAELVRRRWLLGFQVRRIIAGAGALPGAPAESAPPR